MSMTSSYFSGNSSDIDSVKAHLNSNLCIKDLGIPPQLPAIEFGWKITKRITSRQSKPVQKMLRNDATVIVKTGGMPG